MLAKATKSVSEIIDKFQGLEYTCEYKYDGERAQVLSSLMTVQSLYFDPCSSQLTLHNLESRYIAWRMVQQRFIVGMLKETPESIQMLLMQFLGIYHFHIFSPTIVILQFPTEEAQKIMQLQQPQRIPMLDICNMQIQWSCYKFFFRLHILEWFSNFTNGIMITFWGIDWDCFHDLLNERPPQVGSIHLFFSSDLKLTYSDASAMQAKAIMPPDV